MPAPKGSLDRDLLEALVAEDLSVRAIAARTGRSFTTVRYWLQEHGLQTTQKARRRTTVEALTEPCGTHGETAVVRVAGRPVCARCRADAVTAWRRRTKQLLVDEAGGACELCGYRRCVAALHFHHLDPATKSFGLGARGLTRSIARLRAEAAKCALLCGNCHAEVEAGIATLAPPSEKSNAPIGGNSIGRMLDC